MKKIIPYLIVVFGIVSCSSDDDRTSKSYQFIKEYESKVTVGGFIGVAERVFEVGETYEGSEQDFNTIRIRIAEHSELNDDCPNSWCYQELLDVPKEFLKLVE